MDIQKWLIVGGLFTILFPVLARKEPWVTKRDMAILVCGGLLLVVAGIAVHLWPSPSLAMTDCKELVLDFEKDVLRQDAAMNAAYAPFQRACARLSAQDVLATADKAIRVASACNVSVRNISIPDNIPDKLREILIHARDAAGTAYFAKGKSAENILNIMTGEGRQYSTVEKLLTESEQLTIQAALALSMAKAMVGLTQ